MHGYLIVKQGADVGRRHVLRPGQIFTVGRGPSATIRVKSRTISREHVSLEVTSNGIRVTDLNSLNGVELGGVRLAPSDPVLAGIEDELRVGECVFDLKLVGARPRLQQNLQQTSRIRNSPLLPSSEFQIIGEVGRGSTGVVFAVKQRLMDRNVAIKIPSNDDSMYDSHEEAKQRVEREAKLWCRIKSPNVVDLYDVRAFDGKLCLLMELVNGPSAKDLIYGGPIAMDRAIQIGEDIAVGLAHTHLAKVVHRDVKPGNILVPNCGGAKLADFGIAAEIGNEDTYYPKLTPEGDAFGTFSYVSPEQAREAKGADQRSDIYSLGATLFHLIAGHPPYAPTTVEELHEQFDYGDVPRLADTRRDCPTEVSDLIHAMMQVDPANRPPDAMVVAAQLERIRKKRYKEASFGRSDTELEMQKQAPSDTDSLSFNPIGSWE